MGIEEGVGIGESPVTWGHPSVLFAAPISVPVPKALWLSVHSVGLTFRVASAPHYQ